MDQCFSLLTLGVAALLMAGTILRFPGPARTALFVVMLGAVWMASAGDTVTRIPILTVALAG